MKVFLVEAMLLPIMHVHTTTTLRLWYNWKVSSRLLLLGFCYFSCYMYMHVCVALTWRSKANTGKQLMVLLLANFNQTVSDMVSSKCLLVAKS